MRNKKILVLKIANINERHNTPQISLRVLIAYKIWGNLPETLMSDINTLTKFPEFFVTRFELFIVAPILK